MPTTRKLDEQRKVDEQKKLEEKRKLSVVPKTSDASKITTTPRPTEETQRNTRLATQSDTRTQQLRTNLERSVPTSQERPYKLPSVDQQFPDADESERTGTVKRKQDAAVKEALTTGKPTSFETSEGKKVEVSVQKTDAGYSYTLDGKKTDVTFDATYSEASKARCLSKLIDYHAQTPEDVRDAVTRFDFVDPRSENLAGQFRSGTKSIAIFGESNLTESTLNHEMGHAVGYKLSGDKSTVPDGWEDAVKGDANEMSGYGKSSYDEKKQSWGGWLREKTLGADRSAVRADDFAESYAAYLEAKESGPEAMRQFSEKYPNRSKFLEKRLEPQLVDSPLPSSDSTSGVA